MRAAAPITEKLIQHVSELPAYSPPAHSGTVNRRLVPPCGPLPLGWSRRVFRRGRGSGNSSGRHFGELPPAVLTRVEAASEAELDVLGERLLRAETLEEAGLLA